MSPRHGGWIITTGGRDYADKVTVFDALNQLDPEVLVQGGAKGADSLVREWASVRGIPCLTVHAAWDAYRLGAGPIRNQWMLDLFPQARMLVAFPGGKGTADAKRRAEHDGLPIKEVE